ncbi:MAG: methionine adenosyltransferase [Acidobacteria bacterium RIFCSPLOWO2_02_FULL_59_13]|nr:MAG: methionine adenosyltransferase [Acidobacteria bacterium RIFCSPLOWO2_02_FULL_59_13]
MTNRARSYLFTSESVTEGHPDKIADQISDAILDAVLAQDPKGRVACETVLTTGVVFVAGEITYRGTVDYAQVTRKTIERIGYTRAKYGFDCHTCGVLVAIHEQSGDIAQGVDTGGAGDQGMMFGFACNDTEELMPLPIMLSHKLVRRLAELRHSGQVDFLRPDGKSQVSVRYEEGKPVCVDTVVVSTQHSEAVPDSVLREAMMEEVIRKVIPPEMLTRNTQFHINPTGRFVLGGPQADTGLTGRKIIVDTYGGMGHHGGGCFSGKDPTKVDRSACYMARHVAKNLVAAGVADRCEIQLAYAIGVADPVSIMVDTFGTARVDEERLVELVREIFPLTPRGIIDYLELRRPIYEQTAAYGHFGRTEPTFTWESTSRAEEIRQAAGLTPDLAVKGSARR